MMNLEALFRKSKGSPISIDGKTICMVDRLSTSNTSRLRVSFQSSHSKWRQGLYISTQGEFTVNGQSIPKAIALWTDTAPKEVVLHIASMTGELLVKNVWDTGDGTMHSWHGDAGMIVERSGTSRRYLCSDGRGDAEFRNLIFTIEILD